MELTEHQAQCAIIYPRYARGHIVLPNYTPPKWWECDVFEITKAGYFREYEVKCSRSDFFNDSLKTRGKRNKHKLLQQGKGPVQFWFVTPQGLVEKAEVPAFAGLIELVDEYGILGATEVVKAPRLHKSKTSLEPLAYLCAYHRYLSLFSTIKRKKRRRKRKRR